MALIVEDGSVVPNANSYVTLAEASNYLIARGLDAGSLNDANLILGFDYLNSFEDRYQGERISAEQTGSFPREGVCINNFPLTGDTIPQQLKDAQCYAAYYENQTPGSLFTVSDGRQITHEEVTGAVAVDYADNGIAGGSNNFSAVDSLLKPLFRAGFSRFGVYRI